MEEVSILRWRSSTVEQLICNQQVAGSNPIASSKYLFLLLFFLNLVRVRVVLIEVAGRGFHSSRIFILPE